MKNEIQEIYCDESGATGNDLLNKCQPFFAYGSVAISNEEAEEFVNKLIKDYKLQGNELKGKNLLKFNKGRYVVSEILATLEDKAIVTIFHKKYNLACKFFEYIFEPVIAEKNSAFYSIGFHKFIANLLYLHFNQNAKYAEDIFTDFENYIRNKFENKPTYLFTSLALPNISPVLELIQRFCYYHNDKISKELELVINSSVGKWILDLTFAALFTHLATWGEKYEQLRVFCDNAKPLETDKDIFNVMIGRKEKIYNQFFDREQPITFNLKENINLVDSSKFPGIQLADIAASSMIFMVQNPDNKHACNWREFAKIIIHPFSVVPDIDSIELDNLEAQRNLLLLMELVDRSEKGLPLLKDIGEYLAKVTMQLRENPVADLITGG